MEGKMFSTKVIRYYEQLTIFNGALHLRCVSASNNHDSNEWNM